MIAGSMGTLLRVLRPLGATLGIVSLLALQPEPAHLARLAAARELSAANAPRALVLSDQARRFLLLQYRSFSTEFMGCMIGEVQAGVVVVKRIAPADVEPEESTPTRVIPKQTCERAGWSEREFGGSAYSVHRRGQCRRLHKFATVRSHEKTVVCL